MNGRRMGEMRFAKFAKFVVEHKGENLQPHITTTKISDETLDAAKLLSSNKIDTIIRVLIQLNVKRLWLALLE